MPDSPRFDGSQDVCVDFNVNSGSVEDYGGLTDQP